MPLYRATIVGQGYDAMADIVRKYRVGVVPHTVEQLPDGRHSVEAYLDDAQIATLEGAGYAIERHEDAHAEGRKRQAEVGEGDRYR